MDAEEEEDEAPVPKPEPRRKDKARQPGRPPIVQPAFSALSANSASGTQGNPTTSGSQAARRNGKVEIIQPAGPAIGNTYRPAYIPPSPSVTPTTAKPKVTVDTSNVRAGTIVTHKAFGTGQVKGIDGGLIVVTFNGTEKKFQFPGAFEQGFLRI